MITTTKMKKTTTTGINNNVKYQIQKCKYNYK